MKDDNSSLAFEHERLPVQIDHLNQTAVTQRDESAAWHDSVEVLADVDDEELQELLDHMQVSRKAIRSLDSDEVGQSH